MTSVRYAILVAPSANRVYGQASTELACAELRAVSEQVLAGAIRDVHAEELGSVSYLCFEADALGELELGWLSSLAGTLALFRREGARDSELLAPLPLSSWDVLDSDLVSIQKYAGKTNEAFTKLLFNVTLAASAFARDRSKSLSVLDPLCGRGTTLNQALRYGHRATGVELDKKDFEAYSLFIQRWVKDKRLKHEATRGSVKGHPKLDLAFGIDKARYKAGEVLRMTYVSADTHAISEIFQPRSFDLIVTDAPYGVQHGAHSGAAPARKPLELLKTALPVWRAALRAGGAIGVAWNNLVMRRDDLAALFESCGLVVCDSAAYRSFEHRVDASIQRDLLVGVAS